jgi:hypothetical protein
LSLKTGIYIYFELQKKFSNDYKVGMKFTKNMCIVPGGTQTEGLRDEVDSLRDFKR